MGGAWRRVRLRLGGHRAFHRRAVARRRPGCLPQGILGLHGQVHRALGGVLRGAPGMSERRTFLLDLAASYGAYAATAFVPLVLLAFLARRLGPTTWGLVAF